MSKIFAVATYSGGVARMPSIPTRPALRSFLSWARLTRMSLALASASIRWWCDRTGACAGALVVTTARDTSSLTSWVKGSKIAVYAGIFLRGNNRRPRSASHMGDASCLRRRRNSAFAELLVQLSPHPARRLGIREEHRPERDRLQSGTGIATDFAAEPGGERALVEREPADRVHEREAVGAGSAGGACDGGQVRDGRRQLGVERAVRRGPGCRDD